MITRGLLLIACASALHAQTVTEIYNFRRDGEQPMGRLLLSGGDYYGTTYLGGSSLHGDGTVFRLTPAVTGGAAENHHLMFHPEGGSSGSNPDGGLTLGMDGNFYFSVRFGLLGSLNGVGGNGVFFKMTPAGVVTQVFAASGAIVDHPLGELVEHTAGVFFGQTEDITSSFDTAFFKLGVSPFSLTSLRDGSKFSEGKPSAGLLRGADGKYYGGTERRLLSIDTANANAAAILRAPTSSNDANGSGFGWGVTQGGDGTLYGVGETGGSANAGVVWKMNTDGTGYAVLHSFDGATGGKNPRCRLVLHANGDLYGTTTFGGTADKGTAFRIATDGTFTKLADFTGTNGERPRTLIAGRNGTLAGVTETGGQEGKGTIFEMTVDGTLTTLHHFGGVGGYIPSGPMLLASDGNFYGCTAWGGKGNGAIYRIIPGATPRLEEVYSLNSGEGKCPAFALTEGFDGALYGVTDGNITGFTGNNNVAFRVTKDGQYSQLRSFSQTSIAPDRGGTSRTPLAMRTDGSLVGLGDNVAYRVTADGKSFPFANVSGTGLFPQADGTFLTLSSGLSIVRINRDGTSTTVATNDTVFASTPPTMGVDGAFWFLQMSNGVAPVLVRFPTTGVVQKITLTGATTLLNSSENVSAFAEREPGVFYAVRQEFSTTSGEMPQRLVKIEAATGVVTDVLDLGNAPSIYRRANYTQFVGGFFGAPTAGGFLVRPSIRRGADDNLDITLPQDVLEQGGRVLKVELAARIGTAPTVMGGAATGVTLSAASLAGEVNPQGVQTYGWVEFGFTTAYGFRGAVTDAGTGSSSVAVAATLAGLRGGTMYHYRTVGVSAAGVTYGEDQTFSTLPNAAPVAANDTATVRLVQPFKPVTFSALQNDTDGDNDALSIVTTTNPKSGSVSISGGNITYTPNTSGTNIFSAAGDSFNYLISDGRGGESAGTITIVAGVNTAPVAVTDTVLIRGKETVQIQPLTNDTDGDGDTLSIQTFQFGAQGTVSKTDTTLSYTPGKFFTGNDSFTYTITDGFGGQSTATVSVVNPFIPLAGGYEPIVGDDDGVLTLKVTTGGALTGKLQLGAKKFTLNGLVGFDGVFTQTIKRKGLADLVVSLTFTNPNQIATVTGTVDGLTVSPDVRLAATPPAPAFAAKYTVLLTPDANTIPAALKAFGWATASLSAKGAFAMSGLTPDGKPVSLGGRMRVDTSVVLFQSAAAPGSSFVGKFSFADALDSDFSGTLRWTRGAVTKGIFLGALDTTFTLTACKFAPPAKGIHTLTYTTPLAASGLLGLTDGGLNPAISRLFTVDGKDKALAEATNPESSKLTLINRADGRFEGTFKHPSLPKNPTIKFRGVQLQTATAGTGPNKAFGLFTIPTAAGTFTFSPQ